MRKPLAASLMALVAGCNGNSNNISSSIVGTPPNTTASPSLTNNTTTIQSASTETPSYVNLFEMNTNQSFRAGCTVIDIATLPSNYSFMLPINIGPDVYYTAESKTYNTKSPGIDLKLTPGAAMRNNEPDRNYPYSYNIGTQISPTYATLGWIAYQPRPGNYYHLLDFDSDASGLGSKQRYRCVFGSTTSPSDLPSGSDTVYATSTVQGRAYIKSGASVESYMTEINGATITLDARTGSVTVKLKQLQTVPNTGGAGSISLGSYTGVARLDRSSGGFSGSMNVDGASGSVNGTFTGGVFGPGGAEAAMTIVLSGKREDTNEEVSVLLTVTSALEAQTSI